MRESRDLLLTCVVVVGVLALSIGGGARGYAADQLSVSGYFKSFFTGFKMPSLKDGSEWVSEPPLGAVNNRLRLKIQYAPSSKVQFYVSYDFSPTIQDNRLFEGSAFFSAVDPLSYRADDFSPRLYPRVGHEVKSFGIYHNLDRCFVSIKTRVADIFIGRQAIAWGSGHVINPTDIVAPFTFTDLDTEEVRGVDAVRVRVPLGMMSELDMGYIAGRDIGFEKSAFYLRGKTYFFKTDVSFLLMGFRENLMLGVDVTRSIGGAGFWCEAAYVLPGALEKNEASFKKDEADYLRLSVGLDYNFGGKTYVYMEYHFNSAGELKALNYPPLFDKTAYREGAVYLMGKHYVNLGMTYEVTPLIKFSGLGIWNVGDGSLNISSKLEYNIKEDMYLEAGAYLGLGKRPDGVGGDRYRWGYTFRSEFGAYPNMVYTSFRIYF